MGITGGGGNFGASTPTVYNPAREDGLWYQWAAAMNKQGAGERVQGVCPAGFHIPSDCEWQYLEHGQGMSISNQNTNNQANRASAAGQGTPAYNLIATTNTATNTTTPYLSPTATNSSGFSAQFSGVCYGGNSGACAFIDQWGFWWTSSIAVGGGATTTNDQAVYHGLHITNLGIARKNNSKTFAYSVRCLKD